MRVLRHAVRRRRRNTVHSQLGDPTPAVIDKAIRKAVTPTGYRHYDVKQILNLR